MIMITINDNRIILIILIVVVESSKSIEIPNNNNNNQTFVDDHLCTREETYTEIIRVPTKRPVRVRSSNWCLEIPPRCSNYRTEIREVIKIENVTKTRTIRFCCEGYSVVTSGNETICRPICRGGCGRGFCQAPDDCKCDSGYIGQYCTQRCPYDYWGDGCQQKCQCRNNGICDHKNGRCGCLTGWIGDMCHIPCDSGFYGIMCRNVCQCESNKCNPQTGECIYERTTPQITYLSTFNPTKKKSSANEMLESLNSTIANLTENLDKLTREFGNAANPVKLLLPTVELTTYKSVPETLLLITPENPTILIHESSILDDGTDKEIDLSKSPEVIHVIDWHQQQLTADTDSRNSTHDHHHYDNKSHDLSAMIMALIIFSLIVSIILIGFVIFYRQHLKRTIMNSLAGSSVIRATGSDSAPPNQPKSFIKPLPDLPGFTQNLKRTDNIPEFYDCPSNNTAVMGKNPYSYASAALYTTVPKHQYNRKECLESHLYDEIRYPAVKSCRV